jgi:hypothetical protein
LRSKNGMRPSFSKGKEATKKPARYMIIGGLCRVAQRRMIHAQEGGWFSVLGKEMPDPRRRTARKI